MSSTYGRKLPSIPTPRGPGISEELARILRPMKTVIENLVVERNRNDLGVVDVESIAAEVQALIDTCLIDTSTSNEPPPRLLNLAAVGDLKNIALSWDAPRYENHAYVEIFRSTTNDRTTASRIGTTAGATYTDKTANKNSTYYYWARNFSSGGKYGAFSTADTAGVVGQLSSLAADEFGAGIAPLEYLSALPSADNFDGRAVYNSTDNTFNVYEGSSWTTYYPDYPTEVLSALPSLNKLSPTFV